MTDEMPRMTAAAITEAAMEHDGYETPELNDTLYLHFRGFQVIENLEPYTNLKSLWLEANGFSVIEGLSHLKQLRCLFLQRNLISRIENLQGLTQLVTLDVSENRIRKLENLVQSIETLNASRNALCDAESIADIKNLPNLTNLNIENNKLEGDGVVETLASVPSLCGVNVKGNPLVTKIPQFRKRCIVAMPHLAYLDRPIFPGEKETALAWQRGGPEAERTARLDIAQRKRDEHKKDMESFRAWQARCRIEYNERRAMAAEDDSRAARRSIEEENEKTAKNDARRELEREAQHKADTAALADLGKLENLLYSGKEPDPTPYLPENLTKSFVDTPPSPPLNVSHDANKSLDEDENDDANESTSLSSSPPTRAEAKEDDEESDFEGATKEEEAFENPSSVAAAQRRVAESMAIWRRRGEANQRTNDSAETDHIVEEEAVKKSASGKPTWTTSMDRALTQLVRQHCFDFEAVALEISRDVSIECDGSGALGKIDAEACRCRYCELDSKIAVQHPPPPPPPPVPTPSPRRGKNSHIPTFEQLQAKAAALPSPVVPPTVLPSVDDFDDDDKKIAIIPSLGKVRSQATKRESGNDLASGIKAALRLTDPNELD